MTASNGHVVVMGDDRIGVRVLEELVALGVTVRAVCAAADAPFALAARAARVPLVVGDLTNEDILREAGVGDARACGLLAHSDLANLHLALELQELAPRARVVLRLFNTTLIDAVHELVGDVTVISAEEVAAPAFVEAALRGSADFRLRVGDRHMAIQEVDGDDPFCWLALAEVDSRGAERALFPPRASRVVGLVDKGGVVTAEPSTESRGALDVRISQRSTGLAELLGGAARAWWLVIRTLAGILDRRLAVVGLLFLVVVAGSAILFDALLQIDLLDALYFVVTTVTTTGYGDITTLDAPVQAKLVNIAIMMFGGLTLALVFALVTDAVVGARLARALGQHPVPKRDHVIVCGTGRTGGLIVQALVAAEVRCVIVEREEAAVDMALVRKHRIPVVLGDPGSAETLELMRLESARALIVMTGDEMANLQCALLARQRAPRLRVVLRLFDPDMAARVEQAAGIQLSRGVSALAAPAFVTAMLGRQAKAVLPIGRAMLQIVSLTAERSVDVGALERGCDARVLAVPGREFPSHDVRVAPGDELMAVGTSRGLAELERRVVLSALTAAAPHEHGVQERPP